MGKVLCATRGGQASYRTQDAAIALALERGDELLFLYVVDIGFLSKTSHAIRPDVVLAQMEKMGKSMLAKAQERAQKQGVTASYVLHHGKLPDELKAAIRDYGTTTVVLGKPAGAASVFVLSRLAATETTPSGGRRSALARLRAFAAEIEAETEAQVYIP